MKKGGGSESTIIIGPSKSVLVYALHSIEYVLGLARFRVFVPKIIIIITFLIRKHLIWTVHAITDMIYESNPLNFQKGTLMANRSWCGEP